MIILPNFVLVSPVESITARFGAFINPRVEWPADHLVGKGDETLVLTMQAPKELVLSVFGMTPSWAKESWDILFTRAEGRKNPENDPHFSGSKAIFMRPAFRKPFYSQRCAVIADAFLVSGPGRQPYLVYLRNRERPFAMAGLYDIRKHPETGLIKHTFTIITVPGNPLMHRLEVARMPVILHKGRETDWLKSARSVTELLAMLDMYPAENMNAYPLAADFFAGKPFTRKSLLPAGLPVFQEADLKPLPQNYYFSRPRLLGNM